MVDSPAPALSRLPPEILENIILLVASSDQWAFDDVDFQPITQVSRFWRQVAFHCSPLWCKIDSRYPLDCVQLFLLLSKSMPLTVRLDLWNVSDARFPVVQTILDHLPRIAALLIEPPEFLEEWEPILPLLAKRVPHRLRSLCVTSSEYALPDRVFGTNAPPLKALRLTCVRMRWNTTSLLRGLTSLTIRSVLQRRQPTCREFLSILRACPGLEVLSMRDSGPVLFRTAGLNAPPDLNTIHNIGPLVELPRLHFINLQIPANVCKLLLEYLAYPVTCDARFLCEGYAVLEPVHILPLRGQVSGDKLTLDVSRFPETCGLGLRIIMHGDTAADTILRVRWSRSGARFTPAEVWLSALAVLLHGTALAHADVLKLKLLSVTRLPTTRAPWDALLRALPCLMHLEVHAMDDAVGAARLPEALAEALSTPAADGRTPVPTLAALTFGGVVFSDSWSDFHAPLQRALEWRAARGVPLREVHITGCTGVFASDVEELQTLVRVAWDGMEEEWDERGGGSDGDADSLYEDDDDEE